MTFPTLANTLVRTHSHPASDTSPERSFNSSLTNGVMRTRLRLPSDAGTVVPDRSSLASESQETPKIESSTRGSPRISLTLPTRARASSYDSYEDGSDDPPPRTPISSSMRHRRQGTGSIPPALLARSKGKRRNGGGTAPSTPVTATHRHEVALPVSKNLKALLA